jgi:biopolymer transport protein ExbD
MPSVKIPRKSTATDMTPFVDVAFLILSFFMLATKFKPPDVAAISTPKSVSTDALKDANSVMVEFDSTGRIFFTVNVKNPEEAPGVKQQVIQKISERRNLGLTPTEVSNYTKNTTVGVPFTQLKALLDADPTKRGALAQRGIPADSLNNELADWIGVAKTTFQERFGVNSPVLYLIKGDNHAKYPAFDGIIEAMRKNDQFNYKLVTDPEATPFDSELYRIRQKDKK